MKFVVISDTHGAHRQIDKLPSGDVLIHAGDICDRGNESQALDFVEWFAELDYEHKIFIAGNHDFDFKSGRCLVPETLGGGKSFPDGMHYLCDQQVVIDGIKIWGHSTSAKGADSDWSIIPNDIDVLVTHYPPYGILDHNWARIRCGSKSLLDRVKSLSHCVHVFGDIHASYGSKVVEGVQCFNASMYHAKLGRILNGPFEFEQSGNS